MPSATDRLEFAPPSQPGVLRAFVLAVLAHVLLMLALTWGINWKRESDTIAAEAELWASTPQAAAPQPVEVPQAPPPAVKREPAKPEPAPRAADIALEREKQKQAEAKERAEQLERQKKADAQKELKKQELARKAADDRKKAEAAKAVQTTKAQEETKKAEEARRQENLKRMQGLAGATGSPDATGSAQRAAGPSESYGGRIRARVRPNIVFTDDIAGNPSAEVEVRMAPDGTIIGKRVIKSSGLKSWDEAVLRALDKTEVLPRDVDGRVHTPLLIEFRPKN
jgi:colicin import membrane protein